MPWVNGCADTARLMTFVMRRSWLAKQAPRAEPTLAIPGDAITLVGARVGAGAYANDAPVAGNRAASEQLRASSAVVPSATFAALDQAAWHARNHHHERAEQALEVALAHIAAAAKQA